jgi:signal transduction histidine kinase
METPLVRFEENSQMSATKIPIPEVPALAPVANWSTPERSHLVQFYTDDAFLLDGLSRFIGTALGAGDAAVVIATDAHRDGLSQRLKGHGLDISSPIRDGRYVPLDAQETLARFMRDGMPDGPLFSRFMGGTIEKLTANTEGKNGRVAAFGEMVAVLWAAGNVEGAIRLEQLWNDLGRTHSFSLRCAYPITSFGRHDHRDPFLKICDEHSSVIPNEDYTSLSSDGERLRNIAQLQQKEQAHETLRRTKEQLENEVAERREAERKLRASEQSLRELSGQLLRLQDEERRRLGRDLHDSLGQYLAVLKMGLDSLHLTSQTEGAGTQISECLRLAEESIREVRTISYLLYPPMLEEMGLSTAIPWYLEGFGKRSGIETTLDISPACRRLPRDVELAIFRVLQESLTNVHRHSGSATAQVRIRVEGGAVILEVADRGKGIPPASLEAGRDAVGTLGVGLRGMHERMRQLGGKLELSSSAAGTTVVATVPCEEVPPAPSAVL